MLDACQCACMAIQYHLYKAFLLYNELQEDYIGTASEEYQSYGKRYSQHTHLQLHAAAGFSCFLNRAHLMPRGSCWTLYPLAVLF